MLSIDRLIVWFSPVYLSVAICILNNSHKATNLERIVIYVAGYLLGFRCIKLIRKGKVIVSKINLYLLLGFLCLTIAISSFFM